MRFADLLRATVLLSGGAAAGLGLACVVGASAAADADVVTVAVGWWILACAVGAFLGRRATVSESIARALADARPATALPEQRPAAIMLNRLWPLLVLQALGVALAGSVPQVPGVAAGFAILWALTWRNQQRAVTAVEERDGVTFFVARTSPLRALRLQRVPGFRREVPELPTA